MASATNVDALSGTYKYIDRTMDDHGLFQAVCRVNRLEGYDKRDIDGLLPDRIAKARGDLDEVLEKIRGL